MRLRGALALLAGIALAGTAGGEPAAPPRAQTGEAVFDFGVVAPGQKLAHDFLIQNAGDAELVITQVRTSCGCAVASFDRAIAPRGEGRIHAELDSTNLLGPLAKTIEVYTNDAAAPLLRLTLKANVQPHVAVVPGHARYAVVQREAPVTVAQTVWANDAADFRLLAARSPYSFLTASFREAAQDERLPEGHGRQWRVELTLQPEAEPGVLGDFVVLETNHPLAPTVSIPVGGIVRPVLSVVPPMADFGRVAGAESRRARLEIRNQASEAIALTGVESGLPAVTAELKPLEDGRRYQLFVTLGPTLPKGDFSGTLRVHTSSPKQPILEVALKGTVL